MSERHPLPHFSSRPHLWLRPNQPLVCPNTLNGYPHKLRTNHFALREEEDDVYTCQFKSDTQALDCGAVVYVLQMPGGIRFTARVLFEEVKGLRGKNAIEILEYLCTTNPFALDPAPQRSR